MFCSEAVSLPVHRRISGHVIFLGSNLFFVVVAMPQEYKKMLAYHFSFIVPECIIR